jgi:hypothetical protein
MSTVKANAFVDGAGGNTATINGYIPVEQGGGTDMSNTNVKIGWRTDGQGLALQVGATPLGTFVRNVSTPTGLNQSLTAPGSAPIFACRAWVNFNGTGTVAIRASGNVSSITDNGVGEYTINFTTALPDANYCALVGGANDNGSYNTMISSASVGGAASVKTASALQIRFRAGSTFADAADLNVAVFR